MSTESNVILNPMTLFHPLEHVEYGEMLKRQQTLFNEKIEIKRKGERPVLNEIFFIEHDPVITLGKHAVKENVLYDEDFLRAKGVSRFEIERGGDVTFHGPGQLVVYPIIDLESFRLGVKDYVSLLEEAVIRTIAEYGIKGSRVNGATGVWISVGTPLERKICAIGIKISRFITMHGLALNVSTDLNQFNLINPCGFIDKGVTSIEAETGRTVTLDEVCDSISKHLKSLLPSDSIND